MSEVISLARLTFCTWGQVKTLIHVYFDPDLVSHSVIV